jgi:uncharacterized protein YceK
MHMKRASVFLIAVVLIVGVAGCGAIVKDDLPGVAAGYAHTVGLKSDGTVAAVGDRTLPETAMSVAGWEC